MKPETQYLSFLAQAGWENADLLPLAGDASQRRYFRLSFHGETRILMDAPRDCNPSQEPFVRIANHLKQIGLNAPEIYAQDLEHGLILLSDLGANSLCKVVDDGSLNPLEGYRVAVDVIVHLQNAPMASGLNTFTTVEMAAAISPFFDEYAPQIQKKDRDVFIALLQSHLDHHCGKEGVMILRDYHSENILWQVSEQGIHRAGLIDFQDAMIAHPTYDLVSLLTDARRDIFPDFKEEIIKDYCLKTNQQHADVTPVFHLISLQRNLRILGLFKRLAKSGKPQYLRHMPRVTRYVKEALTQPELGELRRFLSQNVPGLIGGDS